MGNEPTQELNNEMVQPIYKSSFLGKDFSVPLGNVSLPRHRWYQFKEGFSESLVAEATAGLPSGATILDPFVGSGTTVVSAGRLGYAATGIEVNPFLAFAARTKAMNVRMTADQFRSLRDAAVSDAKSVKSSLEGVSTFSYRYGLDKWLFNRGVLRAFEGLRAEIAKHHRQGNSMHLALLAALLDCCNAKRDGKCLRYRSTWRKDALSGEDLVEAFTTRTDQIAQDLSEPFASTGLRILGGDARKRMAALTANTFDAIVTSPPYLNSFDYTDVYRPELYAGGFSKTTQDLRKIRLRTVRSHVQVDWERPDLERMASPILKPIVAGLRERKDLWDRRLPAMIQAYFEDIAVVVKQGFRVCKDGARCWIVVSTSAYCGVEIPVDLVLADIATRAGWALEGVYVIRQLRAAGQQWDDLSSDAKPPLRESVIVLSKAGAATKAKARA